MSLLTVLPPAVDHRKPVLAPSAAMLFVIAAIVTLACVGVALVLQNASALVVAGVVVVAAIVVSLFRPLVHTS